MKIEGPFNIEDDFKEEFTEGVKNEDGRGGDIQE